MSDSRENSSVKNELMMVAVRGCCSRALNSDGGLFRKVGAKRLSGNTQVPELPILALFSPHKGAVEG